MAKNKFKLSSSTPSTGTVNVQGRGIEASSQSVEFRELENIAFDTLPSALNVGESFTVNVTGTTNDIIASISPDDGSFEVVQDPSDQYQITVTGRKEGTGTLTVSGDTVADISLPFTFNPAETVVAVLNPGNSVTCDKTITLRVDGTTKAVSCVKISGDVSITTDSSDSTGKTFNITSTSQTATEAVVAIRGLGINEERVSLNFKEGDTIQLSLGSEKVRVGETQTVSVRGADSTRQLVAEFDAMYAGKLSANVVDYQTIEVTATEAVSDAVLTVKGDKVEQSTINIRFLPAEDVLTVTVYPEDREAYAGSSISISVSGTEEEVLFSSNNGDTVISNGSSKYEKIFTSPNQGVHTITISGNHVRQEQVELTFSERPVGGPQFEIRNDKYTIDYKTKNFSFTVDNLEGSLYVKSTSFKVKPVVNGSTVTLNLSDDIQETIECKLILSVEGQEDREIAITVKVPDAVKPMDCNGQVIEIHPGVEGYFLVPMKDEDDVVTVTCQDSTLNIREDMNRIYVKSDIVRSYSVRVTHSEYLDAYVTVNVVDEVVPVVPQPPVQAPEEYYDLGSCPQVEVTSTPEDFVESVLDSKLLTNDDEKLSYILNRGTSSEKITLHYLCTYEENNKPDAVFEGAEAVAYQNYNLFYQLKNVLECKDYYSFRGMFRVILKVFKKYQDSAFNAQRLMRFDEKWPGTDQDLERYKMIISFISKYISLNGQNTVSYVSSLRKYFSDSVIDKLTQFCNENIVP